MIENEKRYIMFESSPLRTLKTQIQSCQNQTKHSQLEGKKKGKDEQGTKGEAKGWMTVCSRTKNSRM